MDRSGQWRTAAFAAVLFLILIVSRPWADETWLSEWLVDPHIIIVPYIVDLQRDRGAQ